MCFWLEDFSRLLHYFAYVIFFRDDVIDFYSNLGNYSFVRIYWTAYCLRIHYHSFKSYWIVPSLYQKAMASLPFIFSGRKHIFLMAIQKKNFFFHLVVITYSKIIQSMQKSVRTCSDILWTFPISFWKSSYVTSHGIEWDTTWGIFPEIDEKMLTSPKISHERCSNA